MLRKSENPTEDSLQKCSFINLQSKYSIKCYKQRISLCIPYCILFITHSILSVTMQKP